jgi:hypothetical protein
MRGCHPLPPPRVFSCSVRVSASAMRSPSFVLKFRPGVSRGDPSLIRAPNDDCAVKTPARRARAAVYIDVRGRARPPRQALRLSRNGPGLHSVPLRVILCHVSRSHTSGSEPRQPLPNCPQRYSQSPSSRRQGCKVWHSATFRDMPFDDTAQRCHRRSARLLTLGGITIHCTVMRSPFSAVGGCRTCDHSDALVDPAIPASGRDHDTRWW